MKITMIAAVTVSSILLGGHAFALIAPDHGQLIDEKQAIADIASKKAVMVDNKICPVSGDVAAGSKGSKMGNTPVMFEYKGKIYHLCCPMCINDFKNNPEKYSKIADGQVRL